tara:strand:- start:37592 stop:38323 length:732 start_codon:yes stop_codon:yes gene_type:complete
MSIEIMTEVWKLNLPRTIDKMVLLAIADNANEHRIAWPSINHLVVKTSASRPTVYRSIAKLKADGYLSRYIDGQGRAAFEIAEFSQSQIETPLSQIETDQSQYENPHTKGTIIEPSMNQGDSEEGDLFGSQDEGPVAGKPAELFQHHLPVAITGNTEAMIAIGSFHRHRTEQKAPLTPTAIRRLCSKIKAWAPETVTEACGIAIDKGWKTLYEPDASAPGRKGAAKGPAVTDPTEQADAWAKV